MQLFCSCPLLVRATLGFHPGAPVLWGFLDVTGVNQSHSKSGSVHDLDSFGPLAPARQFGKTGGARFFQSP